MKGRPITEYPHNGQTFIEGRPGSEYEIELRNRTVGRVEAILSVDGLSIIDGQPAGTQSRGYMINARDVLRIPGWTLNTAAVAKFAFASQQSSYAAQVGQDTRNVGVIGAMVFNEKWVTPNLSAYNTWSLTSPIRGMSINSSGGTFNSATIQPQAETYCAQSMSSSTASDAGGSIGTAFGPAQTFATKEVSFQRGELLATLLCYYDDRRGLKARGINLTRYPTACAPSVPPHWLSAATELERLINRLFIRQQGAHTAISSLSSPTVRGLGMVINEYFLMATVLNTILVFLAACVGWRAKPDDTAE